MSQMVAPDVLDISHLPPLLKRREVAALARCSPQTIRRATLDGELKAARALPHRPALYRREDVLRWLGLAG